ncbi:hypothetical protein E5288_WYG020813 [Bos mutus]|uniref:G-protein coupled receptors family 1 profile domain-containing protein n=1 Tax=Bos mutus TaxID=72004 RepID=A0A6B0R4T9_9CETA|nr:hypothetical protein [Bos mutus]
MDSYGNDKVEKHQNYQDRTVGEMHGDNRSGVSEFLRLGISQNPEQQRVLFWMFLFMYLVTVVGNVLIILAIGSDSRLHTPMYFFLANFCFTDLFFITNKSPKMVVNLQSQNKAISYGGCVTQLYFLVSLVALDNLILATMAFDRCVVICRPLRYTTAMSPGLSFHSSPCVGPSLSSVASSHPPHDQAYPSSSRLQEEITKKTSSRCSHGQFWE